MANYAALESSPNCLSCSKQTSYLKVLPCTHMFCRSCLVDHIGKHRGTMSLPCPGCQKEFPFPNGEVDGLKDFTAGASKHTSANMRVPLRFSSGSMSSESLPLPADSLIQARVVLVVSNGSKNNIPVDSLLQEIRKNFKSLEVESIEKSVGLDFPDGALNLNCEMLSLQEVPLSQYTNQTLALNSDQAATRSGVSFPLSIITRANLPSHKAGEDDPSFMPTPFKRFQCSRRIIQSFCVTDEDYVIMVATVKKLKREATIKLTIWRSDGKKMFNQNIDLSSVSLALAGHGKLLLADTNLSRVFWTYIDKINPQLFGAVHLKHPVLSKPVQGDTIYVLGKNDSGVWEIMQLNFSGSGEGRTLFRVQLEGDVNAFDVSSDGQYFAIASNEDTLCISVYKLLAKEETLVSGQNEIHQAARLELVQYFAFPHMGGAGDVCFYTHSNTGREVLIVADNSIYRAVVLDFKSGCKVLKETEMGGPVHLAKDTKGRMWAASDYTEHNKQAASVMTLALS